MVDVASVAGVVDVAFIVVAAAVAAALNCIVLHSSCCCDGVNVVVSISVVTGSIVVGSVVHTFVVPDSVLVVMCGNIVEVLRLSSSNVVAVVKFRLLIRVGFEHFIVILRHLSRVIKP